MTTEEKLVKLLRLKELTVSAAESCTGGLFISSIISAEGAANVTGASFVTYSEAAKMRFLGVRPQSIQNYGVVSEQVAGEMAMGAARAAPADIGVGITGFAGPGCAKNTPVGTVCFGFCINGFTSTVKVMFDGDRNKIRKQAAAFAVNTLYNMIK